MVNISPSYNFRTLVLYSPQHNVVGRQVSTYDFSQDIRMLNVVGMLPIIGDFSVGPYRTLTGLVDLIFGNSSEIHKQGICNVTRGIIEMSFVISFIYTAYMQSIQRTDLLPLSYLFMLGGKIIILLVYDKIQLKNVKDRINIQNRASVQLYHDTKLVRILNPSSFNILSRDEWIDNIHKYGSRIYT